VAISVPGVVLAPPRWGRAVTVLVLLAAAAAVIAAFALERGNRPYTGNFVKPEDLLVGSTLFCVPVLGAGLLGLRPGHWTGRLLLGSGLLLSTGLFCHGLAVRLFVIDGSRGAVVDLIAWLATALLLPSLGLLPFAVATWPDGRIETSWLYRASYLAGAGLVVAALAQAFAPDHLDGVAHASISNPYGQSWLRGPVGYATFAGVAVLGIFSVGVAIDVIRRAVRAKGLRRRQLMPVAAILALAGVALVVGVVGGNPFIVLFMLVPVVGVVMVGAAWARTRLERSERARAELVRERESERLRVRRDLHDGVGPLLAALRLELDESLNPAATARACGLLDEAIGEVRRISRDLRPLALDELGLASAIRQQAASLARRGGPRFVLHISDELDGLPAAVEVAVYRIAAEAMTNVVRHAKAANCNVTVQVDAGAARLRISDDGAGMLDLSMGAGIPSMRGRAEELGGRCDVIARPGRGCVIAAELPIGTR
jgi:signal transduction histidine kinase